MMKVIGAETAQTQQVQQSNISQPTDATSKSIQKQIANAQKQLQELSENNTMSSEEKMKKRQELQKQISVLNNQLRQHQIEVRKKEQQKKQSAEKESQQTTADKNHNTGMSQASMQSLISADSAMNQAEVQGNVAAQMNGRADVLEIEIKLDGGRGNSVEAKQEELADVQQRAQNAQAAQLSTLEEANQAMKEQDKTEDTKDTDIHDPQSNDTDASNHTLEKMDVKTYSEDGKPVKEEPESMISVQV